MLRAFCASASRVAICFRANGLVRELEEEMEGGDLIQRKFYWHNHPDFAAFSLVFAGAK